MKNNIPKHVAIIMDGNRRWAREKKLKDADGHKKGADNLRVILKEAKNLGVKVLTVYAFSTENWIRPKDEIDALMDIFKRYLIRYEEDLIKNGVRLRTIGNISKCSLKLQEIIKEIKRKTMDCKKIDLVLAINYGGRDEIVRAFKNIMSDNIKKESISEALIKKYLDTSFCSDPDLVIRTSGESRFSNFLLWQSSYSEFLISDVFWPDFSKNHFIDAIKIYQKRTRKFGGT